MKTLDALREVSREMRLMAHYLRLVSKGEGAVAVEARAAAREILEMHKHLKLRVSALSTDVTSANVTSRGITAATPKASH